ncbi:MAG: DUF1800 family protein [Pseudomonadales bacterium]
MNIIRHVSLYFVLLTLISCGGGGGGGGGDGGDGSTVPPPVVVSSEVSLAVVTDEATAIEASAQFAKYQISRTGGSDAISVSFSLSGNSDPVKGSATSSDFELHYSDGGAVQGTTLELAANQNSRVIEVRPVADSLNEIPEVATFTLASGANYTLGTSTTAEILIIEATNADANRKVFLGSFVAQDGVATTASGTASFILQGDNDAGLMNYTFSNLGSEQVDQHIHLTNGPILKDVGFSGPVFDFPWQLSLENGAPFNTEQELLDALYDGRVFINIHTANFPGGEIKAVFVYDSSVTPPPTAILTKDEVDYDIVRFLNQATFGATPEDYTALRSQIAEDGANRMSVYSEWIESQFQLPTTEFLPLVDAQLPIFLDDAGDDEPGHNIRKDAFWTVAAFGKDQLRQRIAFALSQILVISEQNSDVRNAHRGTADYYDTLARHADQTYRDLLEEVSRHSVMGTYLSHLRNEKEDPEAGFYPDENYAREVMQLFSFGLVARNPNGSIKLGPNNLPLETYNNEVIKEMAQVFTGLSFSKTVSAGQMVDNNNFRLGNNFGNGYQYRWTEPMKYYSDRHDMSEKVLFTDNGAQVVIPAGTSPDQELDRVIDALVAHSGTAPYVAERLIQRFVTSNPSPDYIERVAGAFGATGDMAAVVRAILLDEEARNPTLMNNSKFGKFKEPVLQLTAMLRLHEAYSSVSLNGSAGAGGYALDYSNAGHFDDGAMLLRMGGMNIGQEALMSPSVFNFYSPDFAPTGALSSNSLVAPELGLVTETQIYTAFNVYHNLIRNGVRRNNRYTRENDVIEQEQLRVRLSDAVVNDIWNTAAGNEAEKAVAVAEFLDFYMNAGRLKYIGNSPTLVALADALAASPAPSTEFFELATYGSALLPEFMVQK